MYYNIEHEINSNVVSNSVTTFGNRDSFLFELLFSLNIEGDMLFQNVFLRTTRHYNLKVFLKFGKFSHIEFQHI